MSTGLLTCLICEKKFMRQNKRGPIPKFCSPACSAKNQRRRPERIAYEREYIRKARAMGKRKKYEFEYNRRPEVRKRNAARMNFKWHNDPVYREEYKRKYYRIKHPEVVVQSPYTGHKWLDMAREAVSKERFIDPLTPWADDYYDEMGEALLALMEGRDMREAVKQFRSQEYPMRHAVRMGDWHSEDEEERWANEIMPTVESAEDEVIGRENVSYYIADRFKDVRTRRRNMHHATQQPSRRRMNNR